MSFFLTIVKIFILSLLFVIFLITKIYAGTLDEVKNRGYINCGVAEDFIGFSTINDSGEWRGFDVDFCRSVASAIFGDNSNVKFIAVDSRSRFPSLAFEEIDLLVRTTTWSYSRDTNLEFDFAGINFYDGQGFLVPKSLEINNITELDGASICIVSGTSIELNTEYYFEKNSIEYKAILVETIEESQENYIKGHCDVYTGDITILASSRAKMFDSDNHIILPDIISKEPLGPVVRQDDNHWADIIRWTLNVLIIAEEKNLTSENVDQHLLSTDPEILRILGEIGSYGDMLELDNKWAFNIIKQNGNYSTIYDNNLGPKTALNINRGLNELWINGGILYAPPFR